MFYIVEIIKGTPKIIEGLHWGTDNIYDYYIVGCETTTEIIEHHYSYKNETSNIWKDSNREYNVNTFITQVKEIMSRKGFRQLSRNFY